EKVLKDDKEKVFVLEYSSGKEKRKEKVIKRSEGCWGKESLSEEGRVVGKREDYQEGYYYRGCNC
ncbi:37329_t:CDS:2, partial [Gigaspora margarita]